jgi:hypothetical protein
MPNTEFSIEPNPDSLESDKGKPGRKRVADAEGGIDVGRAELWGRRLHAALAACPPLSQPSPERDELWVTVRDIVCTKAPFFVTPHGSTTAVEVTPEHATDELICAMEWLTRHEARARCLSPAELYIALRGQATRGGTGSARAAQADLLRGLTDVPPGQPVLWSELDTNGAA